MNTSSRLIEVLKTVAETDEVERNLDLQLYDSQVLDSMKTVELIVDEMPWEQPPDPVVGLRVHPADLELRQVMRSAGVRWNPARRVWELQLSTVRRLRLQYLLV